MHRLLLAQDVVCLSVRRTVGTMHSLLLKNYNAFYKMHTLYVLQLECCLYFELLFMHDLFHCTLVTSATVRGFVCPTCASI